MWASQSTKSWIKAHLKNSGPEPNQPLTLSDEHSKHLQLTMPHSCCFLLTVLGLLFFCHIYIWFKTSKQWFLLLNWLSNCSLDQRSPTFWTSWTTSGPRTTNWRWTTALGNLSGIYHDNSFIMLLPSTVLDACHYKALSKKSGGRSWGPAPLYSGWGASDR